MVRIGAASVRVSDERGRVKDANSDFVSPDSQIEEGKNYLTNMGIAFDEELSRACMVIDFSARKRGSWHKRPGINKLLDAAKDKKITDIVFFKLARMARNLRDGLDIVEEFRAAGCEVHFVKDSIPDGPIGDMLMSVLLSVASMQADNISDYGRASHAQRRKMGIHAGPLPFWLEKNVGWQTGELRYRLNEAGHVKIRTLIDLVLSGKSIRLICISLNRAGLTAPKGGVWGSGNAQKYFTKESIQMFRGFAHSEVANETIGRIWPAVITDDEADVLNLIFENKQPLFVTSAQRKSTYLCTSIVRCAVCSAGLTRSSAKSMGKSCKGYVCPAAIVAHPAHQGKQLFVVAKNIEDSMIRALRAILEKAPEPEVKARVEIKPDKPARTIEQIDKDMLELVLMRSKKQMSDSIYYVAMSQYEKERKDVEAGEVIDTSAVLNTALETLDENASWRLIAKAHISEARYPVEITHEGRKYKALEIQTKSGQKITAPVFRINHVGEIFIITD